MTRRFAVPLAAILAMVAVGVSLSLAANRSATAVKIQRDPDFHGQVQSSAQCEDSRPVVLKKEKSGQDVTYGHDRADSTGYWEITPDPLQHGDYYAKAKRTVLGDGHICRRGVSQTMQISGGP